MLIYILHKTDLFKDKLIDFKGRIYQQNKTVYVFEKELCTESFYQNNEISLLSNITINSAQEEIQQRTIKLYKQYNKKMPLYLSQDFSFILTDEKKQYIFGARDKMGVIPFYYYDDQNIFIYSTHIAPIKKILGLKELNKQWVAKTLLSFIDGKEDTSIKGIKKLPPAHILELKSGKLTIEKYWDFQEELSSVGENTVMREDDFKNTLVQSVKSRMFLNAGFELSGGLDSSGIAAIASSFKQEDLYAYSHFMPDAFLKKVRPFQDERYYSSLLSKEKNFIHRKISAENRGILDEIRTNLNFLAAPIYNMLFIFSDNLLEVAHKDKVKILFSGFGGDEGVSSPAYFLQKKYARNLQWYNLSKLMNKAFYKPSLWKQIYHLLQDKNELKRIRIAKGNTHFLKEDFLQDTKVLQTLWAKEDILESKDFNNFIIKKLSQDYISERLESSFLIASQKNIRYVYPLLDIDLIKKYLQTPYLSRYQKGMDRYTYRNAIKSFVSEEIYRRNDKASTTVPNVLVRFLNDEKRIFEFLEDVKYKKGSEFIDVPLLINKFYSLKQYAIQRQYKVDFNISSLFSSLMILLYLNESE